MTLPLISYGVSSVFSTLIMFSIVQYTYILVSDEADEVEKEKRRIAKAEGTSVPEDARVLG